MLLQQNILEKRILCTRILKDLSMKSSDNLNKGLILRENLAIELAIERTDMAIDRTLLAFVRTSLYFAVAGMTLNSLLKLKYGLYIEIAFWIIAFLILGIGLYRFYHQKRKLKNNRMHIGNFQIEMDTD